MLLRATTIGVTKIPRRNQARQRRLKAAAVL